MSEEYLKYLARSYEDEGLRYDQAKRQEEKIQGVVQESLNKKCEEIYGG